MGQEQITAAVSEGVSPNTRTLTFTFTLESDENLVNQANLGKTQQTCKICAAAGAFPTYRLVEMQYDTRDTFRYFYCPECETLQIETFPKNIGKYYSNAYYSYAPPEVIFPPPNAPRDPQAVLDVGCGAGKWLNALAGAGLTNLTGCDPFIEKDVTYNNGVKLYKKTIHEMDGRYDIIAFNDSLEHMDDPRPVFKTLTRLLKNHNERTHAQEAPKVDIILPIHPSVTFDVYGPWAFPLDAPRHFFLYSAKALGLLAAEYGFYIESVAYRKIWGHLAISRAYQLGIPWVKFWPEFNEGRLYKDPAHTEKIFTALAYCAAAAGRDDHAHFTLKRREG
jgi:SAM-dependent methyltransferase